MKKYFLIALMAVAMTVTIASCTSEVAEDQIYEQSGGHDEEPDH